MGRKIKQVLWINFAMTVGTWTGFRIADFFFWSEDIKYRIWEESETKFWEEHQKPVNLEALIKFDSVRTPGTVFYSYLPPVGTYIEGDYFEKYKI